MKVCSKCKISKEETEFPFRAQSRGGLNPRCRPCLAEIARLDRAARPESYRSRAHARYWADPEKSRAKKMKSFYNRPPEERAKLSRSARLKNPDRYRKSHRKSRYGISAEEFDRLVLDQKGVCAVCKGPGGKKGLGVDHDHDSKKVRGLLCQTCNLAIGLLKDSSAIAQLATNYLKQHGK